MSKQKKIFIFLGVVVIMLSVPLYLMVSSENLLSEKDEHVYKFRLKPIDPHDMMRGKYIRLLYQGSDNIKILDTNDVFKPGDAVHVSVIRDSSGFAHFEYAHANVPDAPNYFTTTVGYTLRDRVFGRSMHIMVPFDRYYLQEEFAQQAEDTYRSLARTDDMYVLVVIKNGEHVMKELYVNDIPLPQYLREHKNEYDSTKLEQANR